MFMSEKINEILDAASQIFADYGYKKTSMQDIGDRLGMTKSNLYLYFDNKEDLYKKSVSFQLLKWEKEVEDVITSYSIHYTKLYEPLHTGRHRQPLSSRHGLIAVQVATIASAGRNGK